jgi:hypothetical protein
MPFVAKSYTFERSFFACFVNSAGKFNTNLLMYRFKYLHRDKFDTDIRRLNTNLTVRTRQVLFIWCVKLSLKIKLIYVFVSPH